MNGGQKWIESGGGPLVLIATRDVSQWKGFESAAGEMVSDYDRACAVLSPIEPASIRGIAVVVQGDEPDRTTATTFDAMMYLVRWRAAPNEQALWDALNAADLAGLDWKAAGCFDTHAQDFQLFDAAFSGAEIESCLSVSLTSGCCSIETALLNPSSDIEVLLHRFRKA